MTRRPYLDAVTEGRCLSKYTLRTHRMIFGRWTTVRCERVIFHTGLHEYGRGESPSGLPWVWTDDMADGETRA